MKKGGLILSLLIISSFMIALVSAEKLDVSPIKEIFLSGEKITLKVSLLDSANNPINTNVNLVIEDASKEVIIGKTIQTNTLVAVDLGDNAPSGYWKIIAAYNQQNNEPLTSSALFMVELNELARFELKDNIFTIINVGNTRYAKSVQIVIGDTIGTKQLDLDVGESSSFRLIAPEGVYSIKVTDGKTTFTQSGVALTGKVIGILDDKELSRSPLTSTGVTEEESLYGEDKPVSAFKSNSLVYIFLIVLFGAGILLAIENKLRRKALAS